MGESRASTAAVECVNCACALVPDSKRAPFWFETGGGDGSAREPWCPECAVYVRMPQEPARFAVGRFAPNHCLSCGWSAVAIGATNVCSVCGSHAVLALPPKIGAA